MLLKGAFTGAYGYIFSIDLTNYYLVLNMICKYTLGMQWHISCIFSKIPIYFWNIIGAPWSPKGIPVKWNNLLNAGSALLLYITGFKGSCLYPLLKFKVYFTLFTLLPHISTAAFAQLSEAQDKLD